MQPLFKYTDKWWEHRAAVPCRASPGIFSRIS